jgi:hypothetical protein
MNLSWRPLWPFILFALVLGCGAEPETLDSSTALQLSLELDSSVRIDEVTYTITGSEIRPIEGTIDTSASESTASVEVFGLPPADGYWVVMSATAVDAETSCEGSAAFAVASGQTTSVMVTLRCKGLPVLGAVRVDGTLNVCAQLDKVVVSPLETGQGSAIDVRASASDQEDDTVAYRWTAEGGAFADPSAAETTFTCGETADESITVEVSDDGFEQCVDDWTVEVRCVEGGGAMPAWGTPVLIETEDAGDATGPRLAVDSSGNVTLVWQQSDGIRDHIYASRYVGDGPWQTPVRVSDGTGDASEHLVVVDLQGNVTVVWEQDSSVYASRHQAGASWGAAVALGIGGAPDAAVDSSGNVTVVWMGANIEVYATRYPTDGPWGTPESLNDGLVGDSFPPRVAVDGSGNATVVWRQDYWSLYVGGPINTGIAVSYAPAGRPWSDASPLFSGGLFSNALAIYDIAVDPYGNVALTWLLETRGLNPLGFRVSWYPMSRPGTGGGANWFPVVPALSIDRNGNVMVAYRDDSNPPRFTMAARHLPTGGSWGMPTTISPQTSAEPPPPSATTPKVAGDSDGNFTALWLETNVETLHGGVWANRYPAEGPWGNAVLISDGATEAFGPELVVDHLGNATAVWPERKVGDAADAPRDLYARRAKAGGVWGPPARVSNGESSAGGQQLIVDRDGNVTTVWIQLDGARWNIWANRYE